MILRKFFIYQFILIFFTCASVQSAEKIAYLDLNFILNKSKPAVTIINKIEKLKDKETKRLKKIEDNLKKKNEEILNPKIYYQKKNSKIKLPT